MGFDEACIWGTSREKLWWLLIDIPRAPSSDGEFVFSELFGVPSAAPNVSTEVELAPGRLRDTRTRLPFVDENPYEAADAMELFC